MNAILTDDSRKLAQLDEMVPIIRGGARDAAEAQAIFEAENPIIPTLGAWDSYFGAHSQLDANNHIHRVIVDWYVQAVETLNGIDGDYVVYEDQAPLYINFRQSYVQYCKAHKIAPEQDQTWNALYAALTAKGIHNHPTLSTFMLKQSTAIAEVRNES